MAAIHLDVEQTLRADRFAQRLSGNSCTGQEFRTLQELALSQ